MSVQVAHAIVHTPEQAREIIAEAAKIADEHHTKSSEWDTLFTAACQLLGARSAVVMQEQLPSGLDLSGLRSGGGG